MFIPLRDENPTRQFPLVTILIIALNTAIFLWQIFSPAGLEAHILRLGTIPYEITHFRSLDPLVRIPPWLTLITAMFVHGSLFHLLGNMLYLWIFGNNVEDYLGSLRFILFYLICGLAASLSHIITNPMSKIPMVGASGAIAGVLGAYFILYPGARVLTLMFLFFFIRIVAIPAGFFLGFWFLMQILNVGIGGGVAWYAHIGGFLAGLFLVKIQPKRRRYYYHWR
ncbi:MAG: rhomboid family intramembrane serine protease [Candidatus Aminicenantes bacterium]|nr:rhomboid family intramembrane serine protease [Candidatus Aminicenantes bacterium]